MKVEFKKSFAKDLKKKSNDRKLLAKVEQIIRLFDEAEDTHQIQNLKKLKADGSFYRIRSGDYRLGLIIEGDTATFLKKNQTKNIAAAQGFHNKGHIYFSFFISGGRYIRVSNIRQ